MIKMKIFAMIYMLCGALLSGAMTQDTTQRLSLLNLDNPDETARYVANKGVHSRIAKDPQSGRNMLEIAVEPFDVHKNHWPVLSTDSAAWGKAFDLTHYSRLEIKVRKVTEGLVNFRTMISSSNDPTGGLNLDNYFVVVPGGTTQLMIIPLDSFTKPVNEPSQIQIVSFMLPLTSQPEVYQILSVEAVKGPTGTMYDKLMQNFNAVAEDMNELNRLAVNKPEIATETAKLQNDYLALKRVLHSAKTVGLAGKYNQIKQRMKLLRNDSSRCFLKTLSGSIYCWNYPSGALFTQSLMPRVNAFPVTELAGAMAQGEYRDITLMVTAVDRDLEVTPTLEIAPELRNNADLFITDYYRYDNTPAPTGELIRAVDGNAIVIPQGESREFRVRFNANKGALPVGTHEFALRFNGAGVKARIPGTMTVWPFTLIGMDELVNFCYSTFRNGSAEDVARKREALRAMKMYGVNVIEVDAETLNRCSFDERGNLTGFDRTRMDWDIKGMLDLWNSLPGDQRLRFMLMCHNNPNLPTEKNARAEGLRQYMEVLKRLMDGYGIDPGQYWIVLGDEASQARLLDMEIPMAKVIKKAFPELKIFQNSSQMFADAELDRRYFDAFDVFAPCFTDMGWNEALWPALAQTGKAFGTYQCLTMGSVQADLNRYYRVYGWETMKLGVRAMGIWTFNARNRLDQPMDMRSFNIGCALVVENPDGEIFHTRRYEIFRDGINDLRYLLTLEALKQQYPWSATAIDTVLKDAIQQVTNPVAAVETAEQQRLRVASEIMKYQVKP